MSKWLNESNTVRTLKQRNTPLTWFVLFISFMFFIPSLLVEYIWIDLRSVEVTNPSVDLESVIIDVDRTVLRDFRGTYTVTIRTDEGQYVCSGKPSTSIGYNTNERLPEPVTLTWWIGGKRTMDSCRIDGFSIGRYQIETCHKVLITQAEIPIAGRCVMSNIFTIVPKGVV